MSQFTQKIKKSIATISLIAVVALPLTLIGFPTSADAVGLGVPVDTSFDYHAIMDNWKNFVGDRLAVMISNQIIKQMTASVVQWINTGFKGSPAFLTNPEGFFLDVADQVTGALISKTGALASLCSPFSLDIRLNIALAQASYNNTRYACTLSTIINNSRNALATVGQNSSINVNSAQNGATLGNFINGDFSQGGWNGFIAYSTQTQNNPIGASLMAQSDLQASIAQKQANVNRDLNRGAGFLSWQDCKDVPVSQTYTNNVVSTNDAEQAVTAQYYASNTAAPKTTQQCTTQTPGSVIGSSLEKQLGSSVDKIVSIKTISDSIDQIFGALVNKMLTTGLAALSAKTSGHVGGNSYVSDLYASSVNNNSADAQSVRSRAADAANSLVTLNNNYLAIYDGMILSVNTSKTKYVTAQSCFQGKLDTLLAQPTDFIGVNTVPEEISYAQQQIAAINAVFNGTLNPLINRLAAARQVAQSQVDPSQAAIAAATSNGTTSDPFNGNLTGIDAKFASIDSAVSSTAKASKAILDASAAAQVDATTVQAQVTGFNTDADKYQSACNAFPNSLTSLGPTAGN